MISLRTNAVSAKRTTMGDMVTGDGLEFVVTVRRQGMSDLHLGFAFQHQAEQACSSLRSDLTSTTHVARTTISWSRRPRGVTVLAPVPTDVCGLVEMIEKENYRGRADQFPDVYSRLVAQEGYELARRLWSAVCYQLADDETTADRTRNPV